FSAGASDGAFGGQGPGVDRGHERRVVPRGLVGVSLREPAYRVVERVAVTQVAGDLGGLAGAGVAPGEGPAAQIAPRRQVVDRHCLDDRAALLVLELADVPVAPAGADEPAQHHVAHGLEETAARQHAGAAATVA